MAKKFKNFDAFISEMKCETIPFEIFGKTYHIKKRVPAVIVLEMAKHEDSDSLPNSLVFKAANQIFGEKILAELCKHPDFTVEVLSEMIKWAFSAINGAADEEEMQEITEEDSVAPIKSKN